MPDSTSTTVAATIVNKFKAKAAVMEAITIAVVVETTAVAEKAALVATNVKVVMKAAVRNASLNVATRSYVAVTAKDLIGADGPTTSLGGLTSWAAIQPHRQGCYGRAIALWP